MRRSTGGGDTNSKENRQNHHQQNGDGQFGQRNGHPPPPSHSRPPLFAYPPLPKWEMALCWAVTFATMAYGWWAVWQASRHWEFRRMGLHPSAGSLFDLPLFGRRFKDQTNWEWFRWSPFAIQLLPFLIGHSLAFNLLPMFLSDTIWPQLYTMASIAASGWIFGAPLLFCSLAQGIFIFACTVAFRRRTFIVWLSAIPLLYVVMNQTDSITGDPFLVLLFVSYTLLSYISYCLEMARNAEIFAQQPIWHRLCRMLFYTFYQPYLFSLIVLYPDFERQLAERRHRPREWAQLVGKCVRVAFWWALCELSLHFLYFGVISLDTEFLARLPKDQFVSIGMAMGAFFQLKYVVIFGLPACFALLDGLQPPAGPICISRVSLYSKIWRGFDRGLYAFFKEYIFVPICWPTFSLPRKLFGLCVSFTFVLLWHGFHHHNIVWIGLNILELCIEFIAKALYSLQAIRQTRERFLSAQNFRRLLGWLQIVPFAFGLYSNFYFLGGSAVGWLFVRRIFWEETVPIRWPFLLLIGTGYFYMQVAMEVERRWPERRKSQGEKGICPASKWIFGMKNGDALNEEEREAKVRGKTKTR